MPEAVLTALAALTTAQDAALGELRHRAETGERRAAEMAAALAVAENGEREAIAQLVEAGEIQRADAVELEGLREAVEGFREMVERLAAALEEARSPWWYRWFTRHR